MGMEAKGMEGSVVADEVGVTFHFGVLNTPEKRAGDRRTIPWAEISSVTYTRGGKFSTGYLRVNRVGDSAVPKPAKDPQGLTANVGKQADQMKLFADQIADRLRGRVGQSPVNETKGAQKRAIRDARGQMTVKLGARRELRKLRGHLLPGEQVRYAASGVLERKQGLVVLTDRRLLMLFHGHLRQSLTDLPLDRITSVREKSGMLMGTLTVVASNAEMVISQVAKADAKNLAQALRARIASGSLPQLPAIAIDGPELGESANARSAEHAPGSASQAADPVDQLERLSGLRDRGILSAEEFEVAKQRLLDGL